MSAGDEAKFYDCAPCKTRFASVKALLDHMDRCGSPSADTPSWPRFRLWGKR